MNKPKPICGKASYYVGKQEIVGEWEQRIASWGWQPWPKVNISKRRAIEIFGEDIEGWDIARSLSYLGDATMLAGSFVEAKTIYWNALHLAMNANATPIALDSLLGLANLQARDNKIESAVTLLNYILAHPASVQETRDRANEMIVEIEKHHDVKQIQLIKQGVSARSLESIVHSLS